jgi:AcrR family transcriptional regulator
MLPNSDEKLDPRVKRTRQLIEQAFKLLMTEKGFQNLSVQDITEQAGINRATFYAHFPDKYTLLDHAIRQEFHHEIEKRMLNACQFNAINLRMLVIAVCEFVDRAHGSCALSDQQFQSQVEAQVRMQIHGLISHWLESQPGFDNNTQTRSRAATAASWALYGLATEWSRSKRIPPVEEYADQVLPLLAANLGMQIEPA